jgi:hypothetical protein
VASWTIRQAASSAIRRIVGLSETSWNNTRTPVRLPPREFPVLERYVVSVIIVAAKADPFLFLRNREGPELGRVRRAFSTRMAPGRQFRRRLSSEAY